VLTGVLAVAAVVVAALVLPERVPTHFGAAGAPDDWSSRAGAVTFLAVFTAAMVALFVGLVRWVPAMPVEWINIPNKRQWIEAGLEGELRRRLRVDLLVVGAGLNVVCLSVTLAMVQAAHSPHGGLPWWWFVVLGVWLVFTTAHVVVMHAVRYRLGPAAR
jgi:uncharacterized membrane protein